MILNCAVTWTGRGDESFIYLSGITHCNPPEKDAILKSRYISIFLFRMEEATLPLLQTTTFSGKKVYMLDRCFWMEEMPVEVCV
jgi:hypothetical protein